jgi:hypothetical protein
MAILLFRGTTSKIKCCGLSTKLDYSDKEIVIDFQLIRP